MPEGGAKDRERGGAVEHAGGRGTQCRSIQYPRADGWNTIRSVYGWRSSRARLARVQRLGVEYKVFGGAALNLHGLPRFTEDLVFVAPSPENVARLRDVEEMDDARWYEPGDPKLDDAIVRVWDLGTETLCPRLPPGVHKYRGIEEANAAREKWVRRNFRAYQDRSKGK